MEKVANLLFKKIEEKYVDVVHYEEHFFYYKEMFKKNAGVMINGIIFEYCESNDALKYLTDTFNEIKEEIKNENELTDWEIEFVDSLICDEVDVRELSFLSYSYEFTFMIHTTTEFELEIKGW